MKKKYDVEYTIKCHRGLVREINQDNFWCNGVFLECVNQGLKETFSGRTGIDSIPAFAVFDGLGGEVDGEKAAWLAASVFHEAAPFRLKKNPNEFLSETFERMNDAICDFTLSNRISHMGTTAATLMFKDDKAFLCNLGDSRIYLFREGVLKRLSQDHVSNIKRSGKPYISQFLGISEEEFKISPFFDEVELKKGDKYLVCSDGLTDMLSESEIESIVSVSDSAMRIAETLLESALSAGGKDNITVILCKIVGE